MDQVIMRAHTSPLATTSQTSLGVSPDSERTPQPKASSNIPSVVLTTSAGQLGISHNAPPASLKTTNDAPSLGKTAKSLGKGCGLFDWIRLCRTSKDLPGTGGKHLQVSVEELAEHNTTDDAWTAIRGKVYNITPYMKFHPGGAAELMRAMGRDCTSLFNEVHKWVNVESMLSKCVVGTLLPPSEKMRRNSTKEIDGMRHVSLESLREAIPKPETNMDHIVHCCTVEDIQEITHDTNLYTVKLPVGSSFTVPTGHHVAIRANIDGEDIERSYTPVLPLIGAHDDGNTLQLMIKLYNKGKMSQHLSSQKIGDEIIVTDPEGTFDASRLNSVTNVLLVAAGTGFTPMVKVIRDMGSQGNNKKTTKLLFANKKEKDIPWMKELDQLAQSCDGFEIIHVLSAPDNSWKGLRGRIDGNMLREHLPSTSTDQNTLICICGPTPFTASISNALLDMEYPDECIHCFT